MGAYFFPQSLESHIFPLRHYLSNCVILKNWEFFPPKINKISWIYTKQKISKKRISISLLKKRKTFLEKNHRFSHICKIFYLRSLHKGVAFLNDFLLWFGVNPNDFNTRWITSPHKYQRSKKVWKQKNCKNMFVAFGFEEIMYNK